MSTKSTRKYQLDEATGRGFHLYDEVFDEENVYLALRGLHFKAASSVELTENGPMEVVIKLPIDLAKNLGLLD